MEVFTGIYPAYPRKLLSRCDRLLLLYYPPTAANTFSSRAASSLFSQPAPEQQPGLWACSPWQLISLCLAAAWVELAAIVCWVACSAKSSLLTSQQQSAYQKIKKSSKLHLEVNTLLLLLLPELAELIVLKQSISYHNVSQEFQITATFKIDP